MGDGFAQGLKKGAGISFGCLIGALAGILVFLFALALLCSSRIANDQQNSRTAASDLRGEVIKQEQQGEYATFKVKITNGGGTPIGQAQMTLVLFGAGGVELDAVDHYCLSMYDQPLAPGGSRYKDYIFENIRASNVRSYKCIFH